MREVVIVGAKRTAFADFGGALKDVTAIDLGKTVVEAALAQANVSAQEVDEVVCGTVYKENLGGNPGRQIQLQTGMRPDSFASTIDQQCASSMKATEMVYQQILLGQTDIGVAVGIESMSNVPYLVPKGRHGYRLGHGEFYDALLKDALVCANVGYHMGVTAENLAEKYGISRQEQDELAVLSHQRAFAAIESGKVKQEIVPVEIKTRKGVRVFDTDEHPQGDATLEQLGALKPVFKKNGTVTPGNASSLNDGASALVLMAKEVAEAKGIQPLAKITATCSIGVPPEFMGIGPAYAIPKVLKFAGWSLDEVEYFEINEAFAAQFLACNRELNLSLDKVNGNGSGVGLGHPLGATGARLIMSGIYEAQRRKVQKVVCSLCVGGGPAMAVALEVM